jgi:HNH endonuclease
VELAGAGPIPREVALRLTCDAQVAIDGRRAKRTASAALRRARERLDRHCVAEGCDAPPWMLEVHHLKHWADGGETTVANTVLVCRFHHGKLFHDGFAAYKDPP